MHTLFGLYYGCRLEIKSFTTKTDSMYFKEFLSDYS